MHTFAEKTCLEKNNLKVSNVDGKIILKLTSRKQERIICIFLICPGIEADNAF
jgi:hypothetical protein